MTQKLSVKSQANGTGPGQRPKPEVVPQAKRGSFSATYKLRILAEAERCDQRGQIGALLRREGLYSSHLTTWRRQQVTGQLSGSSSQPGRQKDKQAAEIASLRRENERLQARLNQAELIITAQKKCTSLRADVDPQRGREIMRAATEALAEKIPLSRACAVMGYPRSSLYRQRRPSTKKECRSRPMSPRALSPAERAEVLTVLDSERFQDQAPHQVNGILLDEGIYHCSISTMYRILRANDQVRERRDQRQHPQYSRPELLASGPNQLWSWDITKLRGPVSWTYYYLYVRLDVFSRYVVGWLLAEGESGQLAQQFLAESCTRQAIDPDQLTLHADRGSAMTSKTVAQLLLDLKVAKSHSRPYTPDDNPFSESQFKTMKYRPDYPHRFESLTAAQEWARSFFDWYNDHHRHSSLGLMTPATVHYGQAAELTRQRQLTLHAAYKAHPERFVNAVPQPPQLPLEVWINPPPSLKERRPLS